MCVCPYIKAMNLKLRWEVGILTHSQCNMPIMPRGVAAEGYGKADMSARLFQL